MKRHMSPGRYVPTSTAALAALAVVLTAAAPSHAQLFSDDFDSDWDYANFGSVAPGWDGGYNLGAGGVHDANITNASNLTVGLDGVGWEGNRTDGPMQFVNVDASERFSAKVKISSQTAGFWSLAGLIARVPQDLGSGEESYVTSTSFRPNAEDSTDALYQMTAPVSDGTGGENELNVGASWDELMWVRLDDLGGGEFKGYYSRNGVDWTLGGTRSNPELATGTRQVGLWAGALGELADSTVAFDSFEITVLPEPSTLVLGLAGVTGALGVIRRRR